MSKFHRVFSRRRTSFARFVAVSISLLAAYVLFRGIPSRQAPVDNAKPGKQLASRLQELDLRQHGRYDGDLQNQHRKLPKRERTSAASTTLHTSASCCRPEQLLGDADLGNVAAYVEAVWEDKPVVLEKPPRRFSTPGQAVYVAVRAKGARLSEAWETRGTTAEALAGAIRRARASVPAGKVEKADTLEINLSHSYREYRLGNNKLPSALSANIQRGLRGLEIEYEDIVARYAPTYMLASNRRNEKLMELFRAQHHISDQALRERARLFTFEGEQLLVKLGPRPKAILMQRGNRLVNTAEVTEPNVRQMADLATRWLQSNVHRSGRMTYKYWPSANQEAESNNMIRQWMATAALGKVAAITQKPEDWALMERNIDYNLDHFFHMEKGYGLIEYRNQVKLGAVALAAMAILEHPRRNSWAAHERALQRTIDALWNEDGSFTSFFKPKGEQRNQNFYPGEALLYWALLYERERNPEILHRFMASFEYYRDWHLVPDNRNPAFIPWHTQAYYRIWELTGDEALKSFIFTINDWLLPVQQWPEVTRFPDTRGRFYDPRRPFGPPHASSTGVYLEGLIDAFTVARKTGDEVHQAQYRKAINRGLRSVMQLQFKDEVDMFYISPSMRDYVYGGIRTTVYDNVIRCDNVQHNLMAILKILDRFTPDDYGHF